MDQVYTAIKRSWDAHRFAFMHTSFPSPTDEVVEGNDPEGILDANDQA